MLKLRVRIPRSTAPIESEVDAEAPWIALLYELERVSGVDVNQIQVLFGFPPKPLRVSEETLVKDLKLRDNDIIIVQEGEGVLHKGVDGRKYVPPVQERAHFTRRICPSDNSCLFHACAYILHNKSRSDGPLLRQKCVDFVINHPEIFNKEVLGEDPYAYAGWLSRPESWGGGIELEILSRMYETEIFALDLESSTVQKFGTDNNYSVRGFVVYTGAHYDCIAMNPMFNSLSEVSDQVLFNIRSDDVVERAQRFVQEEGKKIH
ncbi:unnamed protein product [Phytomonas sp. Hart1]|nr:unnamed protein product [Phytomonas sp. Hart1]|eukprot:CCW70019.1 unnamed protein product [Phytomonas sp. isolate Hart1]